MNTILLPLDSIRTDGGTQVRVLESPETIQRYADALAANKQLPPIHVFFDGTDYWLADGHHRLAACKKQGLDTVLCQRHEGTLPDAMLFACQSNWDHGLSLTPDDKRNIVLTYFRIPGKENKSNLAASKEIPVSVPYIKKIRAEAGIKPSPSAHVGVGAKNLNGLNNAVKSEGGKNLNRLNNSTLQNESGKTVNVDLPTGNSHEFAVTLLKIFDMEYLKSCTEYLDGLFKV